MYLICLIVLYIVRCDDHDQEPEIARIFDLEEKENYVIKVPTTELETLHICNSY